MLKMLPYQLKKVEIRKYFEMKKDSMILEGMFLSLSESDIGAVR